MAGVKNGDKCAVFNIKTPLTALYNEPITQGKCCARAEKSDVEGPMKNDDTPSYRKVVASKSISEKPFNFSVRNQLKQQLFRQ